jgi:adenine-specific DNA-methyltransferase
MFYPIFYKDGNFSTITKDMHGEIYDKKNQTFNDTALNYLVKKYETQGYKVFLPEDSEGNYGRWRWGLDTFAIKKDTELVFNDSGSLCTKMRATLENGDLRTKTAKSFWSKAEYDTGGSGIRLNNLFNTRSSYFDNPKSVTLIMDILRIATDSDDIIMDFFSGSATTAHAVMQLNTEDGGNRKHIQVQLPEPTQEDSEAYKAGYKTIAEIARERINRAGEKIKKDFKEQLAKREKPLDIGYRTYKLADTNFTKWRSEYTEDTTDLQQRLDIMRQSSNDDATEEDLLTEIILKLGLELTVNVEKVEIEGLTYYRLADTKLVYLNEHQKPSLQQLRTAAETLPSQFVILEDAFAGDSQLKTNLAQICKTNNIELWTI